jgi:hypothetical protein
VPEAVAESGILSDAGRRPAPLGGRLLRVGGRTFSVGGSGALRRGDGSLSLPLRSVGVLALSLDGGGATAARPHVRNQGLVAADDQAEVLGPRAAFGDVLRAAVQLLLQRRPDTKQSRLGAAFAPRVRNGLVVALANQSVQRLPLTTGGTLTAADRVGGSAEGVVNRNL